MQFLQFFSLLFTFWAIHHQFFLIFIAQLFSQLSWRGAGTNFREAWGREDDLILLTQLHLQYKL